jgi:hypothetical protein
MKNSQNISSNKNYLNISQVARRFKISRPSIYKLLKMGFLPSEIIKKRLYIDCSDNAKVLFAIRQLPKTGHYTRSRSWSYVQPKYKPGSFEAKFEEAYQASERGE